MSEQCPKCGLFNPADAARCDCGYDFASQSIKSSYLLARVLEKHGGEAHIIDQTSRARIRSGAVVLVLAALVTGAEFLASGHVYVLTWAAISGAFLLYRGWRQRRQRTLDREARDDLIRRS